MTELLDQGYTPQQMLEELLLAWTLRLRYHSDPVLLQLFRGTSEKAIVSVGKEIQKMIDDGEEIEVNAISVMQHKYSVMN